MFGFDELSLTLEENVETKQATFIKTTDKLNIRKISEGINYQKIITSGKG